MNAKLLIIFACLGFFLTSCCSYRTSDECNNYQSSCSTGGCSSSGCSSYVTYEKETSNSCDDSSNDSCGSCWTSSNYQYENCFDNIGCNDFQKFSCNGNCH